MSIVRTFEYEIVQSLEHLRTCFAVQESKLDSLSKLSEKSQADIREIKDSLQATNSGLALLNKDLKAVADDCQQLNKTVIIGNGVPPLKESIAVLQNWRAETTKALEGIQESIQDIHHDFDADKDKRHEEAKENTKESKKSRFDFSLAGFGWIVVILAVALEVLLNKVWK